MFWNNFVSLCNIKKTTPTRVVKELKISGGSVTGWKEGAVPRDTTLKKIADYFGVAADELISGDEEKVVRAGAPELVLDPHEIELIYAYRRSKDMQPAVDRLLEIEGERQVIYAAAHTDSNEEGGYMEMDTDTLKRINETPETEDILNKL